MSTASLLEGWRGGHWNEHAAGFRFPQPLFAEEVVLPFDIALDIASNEVNDINTSYMYSRIVSKEGTAGQ